MPWEQGEHVVRLLGIGCHVVFNSLKKRWVFTQLTVWAGPLGAHSGLRFSPCKGLTQAPRLLEYYDTKKRCIIFMWSLSLYQHLVWLSSKSANPSLVNRLPSSTSSTVDQHPISKQLPKHNICWYYADLAGLCRFFQQGVQKNLCKFSVNDPARTHFKPFFICLIHRDFKQSMLYFFLPSEPPLSFRFLFPVMWMCSGRTHTWCIFQCEVYCNKNEETEQKKTEAWVDKWKPRLATNIHVGLL